MEKIKVGFIGTGGIAGAHMSNIAKFDDVEFAAMCDVSEDRAKARSEEYGGKPYTDYRQMFDQENLDAVVIDPTIEGLLNKMNNYKPLPAPKWLNKEGL